MIAWLNRHTSMRGRLSLTLILLLVLPLIVTSAWKVRDMTRENDLQEETIEDAARTQIELRLEEAAIGFQGWLQHGLTDLQVHAARRLVEAGRPPGSSTTAFEGSGGAATFLTDSDGQGLESLAESQRQALAAWLQVDDSLAGYLVMPPLTNPEGAPTLFQVAVHPQRDGEAVALALRDLARDVGPGRWAPPPSPSSSAHAVTVGDRSIDIPARPEPDAHAPVFARQKWAELADNAEDLGSQSVTIGDRKAIAKLIRGLEGEPLGLALSAADRNKLIPLAEHLPVTLEEAPGHGAQAEGGRLMTVVGWIALVGVLLAVGMGLVAPQWIWSDVRDSTDRIFGSVARLREIVARNGRALNEQVHSVRQLNESVSVLERASASIDSSTRSMVDSAEQSARVSQSGNRTASVAQRAVLDVRDQVADISSLMDQLGHRCREIGGILGHIDQLNEGTRKLSVNATIKAGDPSAAARQLSFVAGEMRTLAEEALGSTQDIEQRIKEIQDSSDRTLDATRKGRGEVERCLEAFEELEQAFSSILRWVDETTQFAHGIETATSSQNDSLKTVSESVSALKRRAAETEGNFRDIEDAIDELAFLGEEMMDHWKVG